MVVEDDHEVCARQLGDNRIHDFHGVLSLELRIGAHGVVRHHGIAFECFIGPGQADGVHPQSLDAADNRRQRSVIESSGHIFLFIEAEPIHRGEADRIPGGVENPITAGVQRRREVNFLGVSGLGVSGKRDCNQGGGGETKRPSGEKDSHFQKDTPQYR